MGYPLKISEFTRLQLEITNFCNASCPSCERATTQKQLNDYHLDLTDLQKWLDFDSLKSLQKVHLCGNIDEPTLHPDLIDIVKWIPVTTWVATNGGAREDKFWTELGKLDCMVVFGIDGLSDTNHLYRRNVNWKKLERNFRTFKIYLCRKIRKRTIRYDEIYRGKKKKRNDEWKLKFLSW